MTINSKDLLDASAAMPKHFKHKVYQDTCTVLAWNWTHVFFKRDENGRRSKQQIRRFFQQWEAVQ